VRKNTKTGLRTGIYVRVSTEEQVQEGFSIRAQSEKLKSYALLKDWEIYDIYTDEGISGKNIVDRPAITRMIDDIENGKVNNVLVFKVDRLTRNTKNLIELVELFEEYDCAFNSLTESIDTDTPSGRMFLKIIGIFAEFERENLVSRLKLGFERKVKEGYTLATRSFSYGYIRKKGEKIQEIQPEEAKIVKEIFSMYVDQNTSMTRIARILNERKIKTKDGTLWCTNKMKKLLTNSTYIGKVRYSTHDEEKYFEADGHHERILSDEIFYLAQEKIKNMKRISNTKQPKEESYFCGVLVCGLCGSKYTTHIKSPIIDEHGEKRYRHSYRCVKKIHVKGEEACKSHNIIHYKVEKAFIDYIDSINDFVDIEEIDIEDTSEVNKKEDELEYIDICEKKLDNLIHRKKRLMEQYVGEEVPFEEYRKMMDILNEKYDVLESELQRAKKELEKGGETSNYSHEDIIINLKENWEYLDNKDKQIFIQRFIKKIVITVEKERANWNTVRIDELVFN